MPRTDGRGLPTTPQSAAPTPPSSPCEARSSWAWASASCSTARAPRATSATRGCTTSSRTPGRSSRPSRGPRTTPSSSRPAASTPTSCSATTSQRYTTTSTATASSSTAPMRGSRWRACPARGGWRAPSFPTPVWASSWVARPRTPRAAGTSSSIRTTTTAPWPQGSSGGTTRRPTPGPSCRQCPAARVGRGPPLCTATTPTRSWARSDGATAATPRRSSLPLDSDTTSAVARGPTACVRAGARARARARTRAITPS
mmetsp:Transcript_17910/g.56438  ORF Transcript_17910/g.56438 Transcript_17910/m.56438 type:complete len:257 (-) Transcript_17910:88-858(-)